MAERAWSLKLRLFSVMNLIVAIFVAVIQISILVNYHDYYSKVGGGIWAGILFALTGVLLYINSAKGAKEIIIFGISVSSTVISVIVSLALIGISSNVIKEINDQERSIFALVGHHFNDFFPDLNHATHTVEKLANQNQQVCYLFNGHSNCAIRKGLESALLTGGIFACAINLFALVTQVIMYFNNSMT